MSNSNYNANTFVTVLDNGLTVVSSHKPTNTVHVTVGVNVGGRFEGENETGISHFLEHMAFKGTTSRSAKDIVAELEIQGSEINASTGKTTTNYYVISLPENIGASLDILSDVIMNSVFDEKDIAIEQKVIVEEVRMTADQIDEVAQETMTAIAYPDQALGRTILGTEDDVRSITRDMLVDYVERHYNASSMIVVAVGDVNHTDFVDAVQARFGTLQRGNRATAAEGRYVGGEKKLLDDSYEQANLLIAFPAPGSSSDDFACYDLLSDVLGSGMSSPLFQEVRERDGLCYEVNCGTYSQPDHSLFIIQGGTSPQTVEPFIVAAITELAKIATNGIADADWMRARNKAKMQLARYADSQQATTSLIIRDMFAHGRVRTSDEIVALYDAVTKADVIQAAHRLLNEKRTITIAGNAPDIDYNALVTNTIQANLSIDQAA